MSKFITTPNIVQLACISSLLLMVVACRSHNQEGSLVKTEVVATDPGAPDYMQSIVYSKRGDLVYQHRCPAGIQDKRQSELSGIEWVPFTSNDCPDFQSFMFYEGYIKALKRHTGYRFSIDASLTGTALKRYLSPELAEIEEQIKSRKATIDYLNNRPNPGGERDLNDNEIVKLRGIYSSQQVILQTLKRILVPLSEAPRDNAVFYSNRGEDGGEFFQLTQLPFRILPDAKNHEALKLIPACLVNSAEEAAVCCQEHHREFLLDRGNVPKLMSCKVHQQDISIGDIWKRGASFHAAINYLSPRELKKRVMPMPSGYEAVYVDGARELSSIQQYQADRSCRQLFKTSADDLLAQQQFEMAALSGITLEKFNKTTGITKGPAFRVMCEVTLYE